ncbi:acyl-CoA dehydrogenase family protein [Rhodococcus erythropolis]|uniref:acyl-CoA dehydrogenase family protein n=1 Tax=Rhodococcus erythropolis TaxID=1833 RepID=UPI00210D3D44|nr:acyl-CoA dehydrogenase family protein [Rhodococcus erythropolis]MCQ4129029.1 acyl-CoA dehydrogenase family protein [Rhodococcus erythropolis]
MKRNLYDADHDLFRETVREFVTREVAPHRERWDEAGLIDRSVWSMAGSLGLLGIDAPAEYGGGAVRDYRYRMVVIEELCAADSASFNAGLSVQDDLVLPYLIELASPDQKLRWIPALCAGTAIGALALTEPGTGSDLQRVRTTARRTPDGWILEGQKTFITNGVLADVVVVFARTDADAGAGGFTLFLVDTTTPGFRRGRKLAKLGLRGNDTAELFFDDVVLRDADVLGAVGGGFGHLMERLPRERLSIAATSLASAQSAFDWTRAYTRERTAFGQRIDEFQNTRFVLAEIDTELDVAWAFLDRSIALLDAGELTAVDAAKAKWWLSDLQQNVVDRCLQLHGGYGYMLEYPIARAYADARIQPIYGGTNEIMKEIIGRDLVR